MVTAKYRFGLGGVLVGVKLPYMFKHVFTTFGCEVAVEVVLRAAKPGLQRHWALPRPSSFLAKTVFSLRPLKNKAERGQTAHAI